MTGRDCRPGKAETQLEARIQDRKARLASRFARHLSLRSEPTAPTAYARLFKKEGSGRRGEYDEKGTS
ncbi:hypothetical protein HYQ46_009586 [Verticillium longisporum]|nr:hypothetical protein HYQ46_009586 [Verticillium longisporum]